MNFNIYFPFPLNICIFKNRQLVTEALRKQNKNIKYLSMENFRFTLLAHPGHNLEYFIISIKI